MLKNIVTKTCEIITNTMIMISITIKISVLNKEYTTLINTKQVISYNKEHILKLGTQYLPSSTTF